MALSGPIRELSLFTGAGGGLLATHQLGWRCVCASEINPYARSVLLSRQRDGLLERFPIWDDVSTFNGNRWRGSVDIVTGGFPCQDISSAGKGVGIEGSRSGLWGQMARIIGEVEPAFVLAENSPMLRTRGLNRVLGDLASMGYNARWCVLGAGDVGAPHRRKRMWILANSKRHQLPWEEPCRRSPGRMGGVIQSFPWNSAWEDSLRELRGVDDGLSYGVDRTDCIRNAQVPQALIAALMILSLGKWPA